MRLLNKKIIAVASGKGGVGKSILSANIAAGLAMLDKKVIIVDADFGGPNLHALLDVPPKGKSIKDFLTSNGNSNNGDGTIQKTPIQNLWLVQGWDYLGVCGLSKEKSKKLNSHIDAMDADYILIDLGPGIYQNTLDLFIYSDIGIVVLTPEITSILNALVFIKYVLLKKIIRHILHNKEVNELKKAAMSPSNPMSISQLLNAIKKIDPDIWENINDYLVKFNPAVIINRVGDVDERGIEKKFYDYLQTNYSVTPDIFGWLKESDVVKNSVKRRVPFIIDQPESEPANCIKVILHKLLFHNAAKTESK